MSDKMKELGFEKLSGEQILSMDINPFRGIGQDWMLVTAGDEKGWNTMTASWGFAGVMWGKNAIVTVIRPQRYTKEFMDKSEYFSVCFFGEEYKKALAFCGAHSGRDFDKAKETGLVPLFTDGSTIFEQASVAFVCKKLYAQAMKSEYFTDKSQIDAWYNDGGFHTEYIGEIVAAYVKK